MEVTPYGKITNEVYDEKNITNQVSSIVWTFQQNKNHRKKKNKEKHENDVSRRMF